MQFVALPILQTMIELYQKPLNRARFEAYLELMYVKDTEEFLLPLPLFNPMAKGHVLEKLEVLAKKTDK